MNAVLYGVWVMSVGIFEHKQDADMVTKDLSVLCGP